MPDFLILVLLGFAIGVVGGTLGVGGGFILVPILFTVLDWPLLSAVAASHFCSIAVSISATERYAAAGLVDLRTGLSMEGAAIIGAIGGAIALRDIPPVGMGVLFASVTVLAVFRMWRREPPSDSRGPMSVGRAVQVAILAGFTLIGAISAVLGLGGGILKVPLLTAGLGLPTRRAVATSAFMIVITSAAAGSVYFMQGNVPILATILLAAGVLPGAMLGATMQSRVPLVALRRTFAVMLIIFTIRVIVQLF